MTLRTGFIGLGNQGKPIAAHLAPAGFATTVYDIVPEPVGGLVAQLMGKLYSLNDETRG